MKLRIILIAVFLGAIAGAARANVKLAPLFCDGAVLQRGKTVPVWGTASPSEKVTVAFAGNSRSTNADATGKWRVELPAMEASGEPRVLSVTGNNRVDVKDVVVGEVWLASGQSNMERILRRTYSGETETIAVNYPPIRHFKVAWKVSNVPLDEADDKWITASASTVGDFTAVGYYFAYDIYRALGVPVGIINSSWGGTRVEAWMDRDAAKASNGPAYALIYERWKETLKNYPGAKARYDVARTAWEKERDATQAAGRAFVKRPPGTPPGPGHQDTPSGLYNGMIHPLAPYALRGAIWYQGESNANRAHEYNAFFSSMITGWRRAFGQGDFPFYWVQLANYRASGPDNLEYALLREAQTRTLSLPNTGQAVIIDIGDVNDIHPLNKRDVGARLARIALARDYGKTGVTAGGPEFLRAIRIGSGMRVLFKPSKSPLASPGSVQPAGFELAGEDGRFFPAAARMDNDSVYITASGVSAPLAVRYAWKNAPAAGLYNEAGLPAVPFQYDARAVMGKAPASVTKSTDARAAELVGRLRHFVDEEVIPGMVVLVAGEKGSRILACESVGWADIAAQRPLRTGDLFWVASMTKPLTAAAFMMLVDEGRAGVDDPVEKYIPEFRNLKVQNDDGSLVAPKTTILIRHLLSHTSGLRYINAKDNRRVDAVPLKTSVEHNLLEPLVAQPGEQFIYSNEGIDTVGRIIEIITGGSYDKFLHDRLLAPLGMKSTTFVPDENQLKHLAKTYKMKPDKSGLEENQSSYLTYPLSMKSRHASPSGGLFSNADDMLQFCRMLANGGIAGGRRYLSEESVRQMTTKQTGPLVEKEYGFGLGCSAAGKSYDHGGALKTEMCVEDGMVRILLMQHTGVLAGGNPQLDFAKEARRLFAADKTGYTGADVETIGTQNIAQ